MLNLCFRQDVLYIYTQVNWIETYFANTYLQVIDILRLLLLSRQEVFFLTSPYFYLLKTGQLCKNHISFLRPLIGLLF